jgi:ubiquinol-cytochrome c reductase cytochrome c subunit
MSVAMVVVAGLAPAQAGHDPALAPGQVREVGAQLYLQNCASCHGPQGQGTDLGPSLRGVGAASADFYLRTGRMPLGAPDQRPTRQEPIFDDAEIEALIARVREFGPGPEIPQVREGGDLHRGWSLYQANCAACHGASGAGIALGGGAAAVGLEHATGVQIAEAMLIGPGVMPRFEFSAEDQSAIVAYVQFLQRAPNPGGATIGGFGPVSEGFIAVLLGLVFVVIAVKIVGRESDGGHGETA